MLTCLCCGRPLNTDSPSGWHRSCVKSFFGTSELPELDIAEETLSNMADRAVQKGMTVTGVQKKMSLHLQNDIIAGRKSARLTLVDYPSGYILKPQNDGFPHMPETEHLVMTMAALCGIQTVPHALLRKNDVCAYITKRVDRITDGPNTVKLAMEDFCQLSGRLTEDKYKSSYERCGRIIKKYSAQAGLDQSELFLRIVFCYITGNSDMHLKNFSLLEKEPGSGQYVLSPAYDLLPVKILMPEDEEEMAMPVNGKKTRIRRKDFIETAVNIGISEKAAEKMLNRVLDRKEDYISLARESVLPDEMKASLITYITEHCDFISK